ncbi:MAG TPA: aromatic ring-hydroxylating dioxygenase subunit alpha, partial [Stellaceae bacterium]|nr:aromatic ring-hydroxylating dioxygenase subunit alpha [Stellaceae bacterium]
MDDLITHDPLGIAAVAEALEGYARDHKTFQTDRTMTVPYAVYTDEARWHREMELIFRRVPLMLALSCELPERRSYKALDAAGKPVLITRDQTGKVRAFLNVCAHRGSPLAEEGCGKAARLTCPYHGWTFGLDGKLIGVSDAALFGEFDRSSRNLRELPCVERAGMIFGALTPDAPFDVDAYYGRLLSDFEALDLANWTFLGSRVIEGANWKITFDGYLEGYHFATLHPKTIFPRTLSNVMHYEAFGPHLRIAFPHTDIVAKLGNVPRESWGEQENNGFDFVRMLFPNAAVFLAPEIAQIAQIFPGPTPDRNRTVLTYVRRDPLKDEAERAACEEMITFFRDVTYGEDYVLGMKIQKGIESGAFDSIVFGKNER